MKKIFYVLSSIILLASCGNEKKENSSGFEIKGKLTNSSGETVILQSMTDMGLNIVDSAKIDEQGEFLINTYQPKTGFYKLTISDKDFATLILDSTEKVMITGDAKNFGNTYKVEGSKDSQLFWEMSEASKINYQQRDSLMRAFQSYVTNSKMGESRVDSLSKAMEAPFNAIVSKHNSFLTNLIDNNLNSLVSLAAIQQLQPEEFEKYYFKLDSTLFKSFPESPYVLNFHNKVQKLKGMPMGALAPDFTLNTPEDIPLALSSLRGNVVLIDFWASWCGPCRAENPNVVNVYKKYHSKGFEILGVSLDKDKQKWIEAIKKDELTWLQVSDLKWWKCEAAQLYGVNSIPMSFLIDKEGKIIAKNLRGEALDKKLEEVFK